VNQLAAILPSGVAVGNYNVTVTNGGVTSAPFAVTVVQSKIGLITQDGSGSGLAVVQNYISGSELDVDRFTVGSISGVTISPARPGQTLIAWATGMGPVSTADNMASPGYNFAANGVNVQVIVGGVSITPLYAGRAPGLAGADQINFVLPANVPTGCTVSFVVSVNGALSNPTFISIAPSASASACVQPGYTTAQLQSLDQGGTVTTGSFDVTQFAISETVPGVGATTAKVDAVSGAFSQYTGFQLASVQSYTTPANACQVYSVGSNANQSLVVGGRNLDAGQVTLTGPAAANITSLPLTEDSTNAYSASIATEIPGVSLPGQTGATVVAGTYTLKGFGGTDVGAFTAQMGLSTPLTITGGLPSTVTRANGLTLSWTGGNSTDVVLIVGSSGTTNGTEFVCTTTAGQGKFTVPASVLNQLAASTTTSTGTPSGFLTVESSTAPSGSGGTFTAPLTAGGSVSSTFLGLIGTAASVIYQ
jgi:uncharacterized protein (TIGR03437 family)